MDKKEK